MHLKPLHGEDPRKDVFHRQPDTDKPDKLSDLKLLVA